MPGRAVRVSASAVLMFTGKETVSSGTVSAAAVAAVVGAVCICGETARVTVPEPGIAPNKQPQGKAHKQGRNHRQQYGNLIFHGEQPSRID